MYRVVVITVVAGAFASGPGDRADGQAAVRLLSGESTALRTPAQTVRSLIAAGKARDGRAACALVTRNGRSVIDAPNGPDRRACVDSVEDLRDEEVDVRLLRVRTVKQAAAKASVRTLLREDGKTETWILELVRRTRRGWLVDDAVLRG